MAIKWDYEAIANGYNYDIRNRGLRFAPVTADEVKNDLRGHRKLWQKVLTTNAGTWYPGAYLILKEHLLEPNRWPVRSLDQQVQADFLRDIPILTGFERGDPGTVPPWLRREVRHHLSFFRDHPEMVVELSLASFTLKLAVYAYQDAALRFAKRRVKQRWRMTGSYPKWLNWLLKQEFEARRRAEQEARLWLGNTADDTVPDFSVDNSFRHRERRVYAANRLPGRMTRAEWFIHTITFGTPFDQRDTSEDKSSGIWVYHMPLADYKQDLGQIVRLLGGNPRSKNWQEWAEAWLWDFPSITVPQVREEFRELLRGLRERWNVGGAPSWLSGHEVAGKLLLEGHRLKMCPELDPVVRGLTIELTCRWVRLNEYPKELQPELYTNLVRMYGGYEEPRSAKS